DESGTFVITYFACRKSTKKLRHNKALACESRGFAIKKENVPILTHPLFIGWLTFSITSESK
ncbi:MAG: hypothetical protein IKG96_07345, partial [Bacteroidaceae bacterium]|nr:hypothetical protein [Bacteroidaceae bacterium]